ncbi:MULTISPECIES: Mrp/NBP35 family ATP-binding protein [Sphingomonadales]|uniref:Iron-sulfur cluster carrier protein n=1 Tax=Edaphosphingomonas haloaromaticamans TaxID=653954 RepID=A0A1S1HIZ9_9SPHN|nr:MULTISPECIES: Mrp/NBP35 family ATP-binding protein [Sphingomonas]AGH49669.1 chromosome partitioning ATPase [Sphingomonas sp. MM-1]OHT22244.1 antiporter inner membrane protein [Sphingomonas haloaromaticamans]
MSDSDPFAAALDAIADPVSGRGLIASGRAAAPRVNDADATASVILDVTGLSGDDRAGLERAIRAKLIGLGGLRDVRIAMTAEKTARRLIVVGSGKGGVGKSTLAANLAVALKRLGAKVGLVDADIYGPSQARLLATEGRRPEAEGQRLLPIESPFGLPMLSMAHLVKPGQAIAWRGPMAGNALGQLIEADWGDVDTLILDLPPGTGDVQLSLIQKHKPAGAIIVSTPQDLALIDATRAIDLFRQATVPIIGLVENMAGYACPHCGEVSDPFGAGGAEAAAGALGVPFLGRVPLEIAIRKASDAGDPPAAHGEAIAQPFLDIAGALMGWLNAKAAPTF